MESNRLQAIGSLSVFAAVQTASEVQIPGGVWRFG